MSCSSSSQTHSHTSCGLTAAQSLKVSWKSLYDLERETKRRYFNIADYWYTLSEKSFQTIPVSSQHDVILVKLVSAVILCNRVPVIITDVTMAGVLDVDSGISDSTGARPVRYWSIRSLVHKPLANITAPHQSTYSCFPVLWFKPDEASTNTNCYRNLLLCAQRLWWCLFLGFSFLW